LCNKELVMIVKSNIFSDGERRPLSINDNGEVDFWTTLYLSVEYRSDGKASTIKNELYKIEVLRKWEAHTGRDILAEFRKQVFLDKQTILSIKRFCGYSIKDQKKSTNKVIHFSRVAKSSSALSSVSKEFQYQRMLAINQFLEFCAREICKFKPNSGELNSRIDEMCSLFKKHYPKGLSKGSKATHAETEILDYFLKVAHYSHELNPFSNFNLKFRNYLLIQILYWTGVRPSEVLALRLEDLEHDTEQPALLFRRRHDDKYDPREDQPTLKTQEKVLVIPKWLYDDIELYIRQIRPSFAKSKSHPYLFVSHKGNSGTAMGKASFADLILKLKQVDKRFENVQRRGFRIYFNERISDKIDEHNGAIRDKIREAEQKGYLEEARLLKRDIISEADEIDTRMRLNGHAHGESANAYLQRHARRTANKVQKQMMEDHSEVIKGIKDARNGAS